jgi:hypothetical protein
MDAIRTEKYRGFNINIYHDDDPINPREWDNMGTMVCFHDRYNLGDEQETDPQGWIKNLAMELDERLPDIFDRLDNETYIGLRDKIGHEKAFNKVEAIEQKLIQSTIEKHAVILPLYLYDHSGIKMSTSEFSCPWDSGQVGFIYCTLDDARREGYTGNDKTVRDEVTSRLIGEVEEYDYYLTGEVYGYMVEPNDANKAIECDDSCWGFFGYNYAMSDMVSQAKHAIGYAIKEYKDAIVAEYKEKHLARDMYLDQQCVAAYV